MKYKIFMGWDSREALAYEIAKHSILRHSDESKVQVYPIELLTVKHLLDRPTEKRGEQYWDAISDAPMSTEFAISRFCVPFMTNSDWALFMDSDMVCLTDIEELFKLADDKYAIMCVKHNHIPAEDEKFHDSGMIQTIYERKNWSSLVLWNLRHPANKRFTLKELNTWRGLHLHQFKWLEDHEIGELPQEWNFLVGVNEGKLEDQKMLHYTNGSPAWGEKWIPQPTDYIWNAEYENYKRACLATID